MVEASVETKMDALRKRLLKAVKTDGIVTYKELSLALRQNPTFVQQFVTRGSPKRLYDEQVDIITSYINQREAGRIEVDVEPLASERLHDVFIKLADYPSQIHDRVISFAEFEMASYDKSRENDKNPES